MKHFFAYIITLCLSLSALGQVNTYSYVYIEGDKETPFYVKLEGTMQPRLGKHYAILSNLDKGYTKVEVLFEQNKYPAQTFFINVPENASRSLQLRKLNDGKYALYDLIGGHYITANSKQSDNIDHLLSKLSAPQNSVAVIKGNTTSNKNFENKTSTSPISESGKTTLNTKTEKTPKAKDNTLLYHEGEEPILAGQKAPKTKQNFIDNVAINNNDNAAVPPNTDCKSAISNEEFGNYLIRIQDKSDDEAKLKYIQKQRKSCYTTAQIEQMALSIKSQSGRMQLLQYMYAQVYDPQEYRTLERVFSTDFLKKKFIESL